MKIDYRVGILGAGLGSRLKSHAEAKPLAKLGSKSLLEILLGRFLKAGASEILCALRSELMSDGLRQGLPRPKGVSYIFKDTDSSLHTLAELIRGFGAFRGPVLFSMADTVMLPGDFERFLRFCGGLAPGECAVLLTSFIDDEKPLYAAVNERNGQVIRFGPDPGPYVTSGIYFLTPQAMEIALELVDSGTHKMRNFLSALAERGLPIKSFVVSKTIDVDHPSDLEKAAAFLSGDEGISS